LLQPQ